MLLLPVYVKPNVTEATSKSASPSSLTYTSNRSTATVNLDSISAVSGSFATSTSEQTASFSISTNNATGYTLTLKTTGNDTALTDDTNSNTSTNHLNTISSSTTADDFTVNTWGLIPSKYNGSANTTTYYPASSTGFTIDETTTANATANNYTVGIGIKVNYDTRSATYTNDTLIAEYVANPVTYSISYYSNTSDTVEDMPLTNPQTGTISDPTTSTGDIITTLASAPTRDGYTFLGWCAGNSAGTANITNNTSITNITTTNDIDSCSSTVYDADQSFGINATGSSPDAYYLYAMWSAAAPDLPCEAGYICYRGNGATAGTMPDQEVTTSTVMLTSSNFSRPGYGFAGWNTAADGTGTNYGPAETINPGNLSTEGLKLYAKWLAPSGVLQTWAGASNMSVGDVIALRDNRDNEVYAVAKLADNNVWITENLRLVPNTANITDKNTHNPTSTFLSAVPSSSSSTTQCSTDDSTCNDHVYFYTGNMDRTKTQSPINNDYNYAWYSYGTMYNWYTATAGNGTNSKNSGSVSGDICPSGWHLPTGGSSGEYTALASALGGNSSTGATNIRKYPNNFIWSGDYNPSTQIPDGRGVQARLWSATAQSAAKSYRMGFNSSSITPAGTWNKWDNFAVRCIYQGGNLPYSAVTVDFEGTGINSLTFTSQGYDTETATPASPTISIVEGAEYTVTANLTTGYEVSSWSTTTNGTLGNTTTTNPAVNPNTYTITGDATLTVTGQITPTYDVTVTLGEHVTGISFSHPTYGTINITPQNSTDNGDGTYTNTATLYRGVEYTLASSYEDGYTLHEWVAGANSTIGSTTAAATTYSITGNTTLSITAEETDEITYNLVYSAGSGTDAPDTETVIAYTNTHDFTITNSAPIYYGYTFTGWSETPDANNNGTTVDYTSGDTITVASTGATTTKTLYPVYQAVSSCPSGKICYYENGADVINGGRGTMSNQSASSDTATNLIPTNYSKAGYGFAGWTTDANATPYGPNATITTPDLSSTGLSLYAKWVKSTGTLQTWNGCNAMTQNSVIALTDSRDNETYAVAKLADDNCWIVENLRLVPSAATITNQNTHNPASGFATAAASSSSVNTMCNTDGDTSCNDQIQYNTNSLNRSLTQTYNGNNSSSAWYSYGVYYNWYTATAGNGTISTEANANAAGDICPARWHLPTSTSSGEYAALNTAINSGSTSSDAGLRAYPANFLWSGDYKNTQRNSSYSNGRYWTATGYDSANSYRFGFQSTSVTPSGNYRKWDGFAVRCVYDGEAIVYSNVVVNLPQNVTSVTFVNNKYGTQTATTSNNTVSIVQGATYTIMANTATSHKFTSWINGANSTIGNINDNPTTFGIIDDSTLSLTVEEKEPVTVVYHGNGLLFDNDATTNTVEYYISGETTTRYAHTSNVDNAGTKNGNYPNNANTNTVISIPGSVGLHITLTYETESTSYDWVSFWAGSHSNYTASNNYETGIKCGDNTDGKYGGDTKTTIECVVPGDTVTFSFTSDGSANEYYGYYAIVSDALSLNSGDGSYAIPTSNNPHLVIGWDEDANAEVPTYKNEDDIRLSLPADTGDTIDLYAIYITPYTVTVSLDEHTSSVGFYNDEAGAQQVVNNNNNGDGSQTSNVNLYAGYEYIVAASFDVGYELNEWDNGANSTIDNGVNNPIIYIITDDSTLDVTSRLPCSVPIPNITYMQEINYSNTSSVLNSIGTSATHYIYDSRDNERYCVSKLADGNLWLLDNLSLDLTTTSLADLQYSTNATNDSLQYLKGELARDSVNDADGNYATAEVSANWNSSNYSAPLIDTTSKNVIPTGGATMSRGYNKVGVYYNYCAVTAGSYCYGNGTSHGTSVGDATEDICPAGWRIPTGSSAGEYRALYEAYASNSDFIKALSIPLSGYAGSSTTQGNSGFFWSSTRNNDTNAYTLSISSSNNVSYQNTNNRSMGYSVRCVLHKTTDSYPVTVILDENVKSVTFSRYGSDTQTVTATGSNKVLLKANTAYTISASFVPAYKLGSWSTTANGAITDTTKATTSYKVTGISTLSVTSQVIPPYCGNPLPGITYMQEITENNRSAVLARLTTNEAYYVKDYRDGEYYCVSKMGDGNLWMLDNLATDLEYLPLDALKNGTNASNTSLEYLKGIRKRDIDAEPNGNYAVDGVTSTTNSARDIPFSYLDYKEDIAPKQASGSKGNPRIGGYYTYCAATAGSNCFSSYNSEKAQEPTEDICPSGWRLPSLEEFKDLTTAITGKSADWYGYGPFNHEGTNHEDAAKIHKVFSTTLAGIYGRSYLGRYGIFLSSTTKTNGGIRILHAARDHTTYSDSDQRDVYLNNGWGDRASPVSVRCLLYKSTDIRLRQVTVNFDAGVNSVSFYNSTYGTQVVNTSGDFASLRQGVEYTVTANINSGYNFASWSTFYNGTISNAIVNPSSFIANGETSLIVSSDFTPLHTTTVNLDECTESVKIYNAVYGTQIVTNDNNNGDGTHTGIAKLKPNIEYTITASMVTGCAFSSWSNGVNSSIGSTTTNPTIFTITDDTSLSISAHVIPSYNVTVNLDAHSASVSFYNATYGTQTVTNSNNNGDGTHTDTVSLREGIYYTISSSSAPSYEFDSWIAGANSTLGSTTSAATTYMITDTSTLSLTSIVACRNPLPGVTYMQDITASNSSSIVGGLTTNAVYYIYDVRDNERYCVSKLADGNLWMLDNLAIDLTTVSLNILKGNTNATDTSLEYLKGVRARDPNTDASGNYATAGIANWTTSNSYSAPLMDITNKNTVPSNGTAGSKGQNKVGGYYNFCAVSAGSYCYGDGASKGTSVGNAAESICPSGWHIPTGASTGEYQALATAVTGATLSTYSGSQATAIKQTLSMTLSGVYFSESTHDLGTNGFFWSSTRSTDSEMQMFRAAKANVYLTTYNRSYGNSVRCVLHPTTTHTVSVNLDTGVSDITFYNSTYGTQTVTTSGSIIQLRDGVSYTITAGMSVGYAFSSWSNGANSSIGSTTTNPTTFTITDDTSLSISAQVIPSYNVTVNLDVHSASVSFYNATYGTQTVTNSNNNGDGTHTDTVSLKASVPYTLTANFASGYEINSWSTTADGTIGSTTSANTTYTISGISTLNVTSKFTPPSSTCDSPIPGVTYMQDITSSNSAAILANLTTNDAYYLIDNRDNTAYCVSKLADGNLWMLDNLAIDLATVPLNTLKGNTNATDTSLEYLKGVRIRNPNTDVSGNYATAGVSANWSTNSYSAPLMQLSGICADINSCANPTTMRWDKDDVPSGATTNSKGQNKIGGYYNFCAASAGSYCYGNGANEGTSIGDATEDICPSGWHMPTGASNGEYQALATAITSTANNYYSGANATAIKRTLSIPLSGWFSYDDTDEGAYLQGSSGFFWSSTRYGNYEMYRIDVGSSSIETQVNGAQRHTGHSIRCLLN